MGLFDLFRKKKPAYRRLRSHAPEPEAAKSAEELTQEAVELLRPHLMPACFGDDIEAGSELSPVASKFGGDPYAEADDAWPLSGTDGSPLTFICQINRRDVPFDGPMPDGLLVLFMADERLNCDLRDERGPIVMRHYPQPSEARYRPLARPEGQAHLNEEPARQLRFTSAHSLPDQTTVGSLCYRERYGRIDQWGNSMGLGEWCKPFEEAVRRLVPDQPNQWYIQIGGHPQWVQYPETPDEPQYPDERFLLQVNDDDGAVYIYLDAASNLLDYAIYQIT